MAASSGALVLKTNTVAQLSDPSVPCGDATIPELVAAETGNTNDNNNVPQGVIQDTSFRPQSVETSTTYEQGEQRKHQFNLEHWAHYHPRF